MTKRITLLSFLILLLGACVNRESAANSVPLNVIPGLSTAELAIIGQATSCPTRTTDQALQLSKSLPSIQTYVSEVMILETPGVIPPPTNYPAQTGRVGNRSAYPAPSAAVESATAYPVPPAAVESATAYPVPPAAVESATAYPAPPAAVESASAYPTPSGNTSTIPLFGYRVVNQFIHDPNAYTQGLVVTGDGSEFIEGTGLWGQSSLRRVDIETGEVTQFLALPDGFFGEGLTIFEDRILQFTWKSNTGFIYDKESFDLLGDFDYAHEGWGITHDGQQLIVSDGTATLHFWDPETLTETRQIQVTDQNSPVPLLNELEYVEGEILANVWYTDRIARISPESGKVIGWIDLTGLYEAGEEASAGDVLNGIAYDDQTGRLFVTGKRWPVLFEIELIPKLP